MESKENELINSKMNHALLKFALPFMFASFLQAVYGAVDLFVVGQYANSAAVSAVSIGSQLMQLATVLITGLSMGGTVEIGVRIGEQNIPGVCRAIGNLIIVFLVMTVVLTPAMLLGTGLLVDIMQTPVEAVPDCRTYMRICSAGLPFIVGYNAISGIYRGTGDSRTPVLFIGIATIINIVLDFALTGGLGMGAAGAAIATITAQGVSFLCAVIHMMKGGFHYPIQREHFRPKGQIIGRILKVGFPLALQDVLVHFSFLAISAIINTLGLIASAAVGIAEKLMGFAFIIPGSFGGAVATAVAQNIGAGNIDRTKQAHRWGILYSGICGIIVCILCFTIPKTLVGLFSRDAAVIASGATYIGTYSIDCILTAFVFCTNGYLNGNGKSVVCFAHSMAATFLVRIPVTWGMSLIVTDSLAPMGLAAPAASLLSIIICLIYMRHMEKD